MRGWGVFEEKEEEGESQSASFDSHDNGIDRTEGAWLLTGMALFMISVLHVNPHSLSDSNLEYGQSQPYC